MSQGPKGTLCTKSGRPWRAGQKRVVEFGEWLCEEVLKAVPHRHFVFSIPKILRRYFLYDRKLLSDLSRCGWETLKEFFREAVPEERAVPGAVVAIHSFGDFLGWHPHLHVLCTDGCFCGNGMFRVAPLFELKHLQKIGDGDGGQVSQTKASKWCVTMASTATWRGASAKRTSRTS